MSETPRRHRRSTVYRTAPASINRFNLRHVAGRDGLRHGVPAVDPGRAVRQGLRRAVADAVHADDAAARLRRAASPTRSSAASSSSRVATFISTPIGILAGIYLAEFGKDGWIAPATRFINDILLSAPSIVIGLFVYTVYVAQVGHFSGWAGSFALALIAIPVVVRTTENMLHLVPDSLREAAVALGAPMWKVILMVTLRAVRGGVITGVLLAVARMSGETAPLLFTALNNQFWSADMNAPMANLPVVIFQFAMSPYEDWKTLAWARRAADHADRAGHQHPRPRRCSGSRRYADGTIHERWTERSCRGPRRRRRRCRRRRRRCRSATSTSTTASSRR